MDRREINEEYNEIMHELIEERPELEYIKYSGVTIVCLSSCHQKKKKGGKVFGECEKVQEKNKWSIPCDFTITIFEPNIIGFTDKQLRILIFHELLHVGVDCGDYYIRPHDLEDFKKIIDEFGTDWAEVKKDKVKPEEEDEQKVESV